MKKIALVLFVVLAAILIASCSTVMPVAGATGSVGKKQVRLLKPLFLCFH